MRRLALIPLLLLSNVVAAQPAWQLVKDDNDVSVYTTLQAGNTYKTSRAVGIADVSAQDVLAVLNDATTYRRWFAFAKTVELLKFAENTRHVYLETDFPWPFRNQDMVYEISYATIADGSVKYSLLGKPQYIPLSDGINRMQSAEGYFLVQPTQSQTRITYVMHATLGGGLPPRLANRYMHELPFKTLQNLIELVENTGVGKLRY